eukprot:3233729-Rhodomonas_salina.3
MWERAQREIGIGTGCPTAPSAATVRSPTPSTIPFVSTALDIAGAGANTWKNTSSSSSSTSRSSGNLYTLSLNPNDPMSPLIPALMSAVQCLHEPAARCHDPAVAGPQSAAAPVLHVRCCEVCSTSRRRGIRQGS